MKYANGNNRVIIEASVKELLPEIAAACPHLSDRELRISFSANWQKQSTGNCGITALTSLSCGTSVTGYGDALFAPLVGDQLRDLRRLGIAGSWDQYINEYLFQRVVINACTNKAPDLDSHIIKLFDALDVPSVACYWMSDNLFVGGEKRGDDHTFFMKYGKVAEIVALFMRMKYGKVFASPLFVNPAHERDSNTLIQSWHWVPPAAIKNTIRTPTTLKYSQRELPTLKDYSNKPAAVGGSRVNKSIAVRHAELFYSKRIKRA